MKRIYVPSAGLSSWQALLAEPNLHWKRKASAMELAASWELASSTERGLPLQVEAALDAHDSTRNARLVFAFPEHRVALPGGSRASQTDLWAVMKADDRWISMAVEGKAGEPFGPTVGEWSKEASLGKQVRMKALRDALGVSDEFLPGLRYQLFHRTASAVLEATRIGARTAVLIVQNFRENTGCWTDFEAFVELLGAKACRGGACEARNPHVDHLLLGWIDCLEATDSELAQLV